MKKIIFILIIFLIGSIAFAENIKEEAKNNISENSDYNANNKKYTSVVKGSQTFYYDKFGKLIAHDKVINNQTFFYNKVGQLIGKSVERENKIFYYSSINKFLGVCDEQGCFDSNFISTGNVPPLPKMNEFKPILNEDLNNNANTSNLEDKE